MHSSEDLGQLRPGDVLAGRYFIVDLLDESRGGRFWRAEDKVLARPVALHVIPDDDDRGDGLLEAARLSATVQDPCILRVLDADCVDGMCFVVNEWGSGASLDVLLARDGPLPPRRAAWIVAEVAAMVTAAHEVGVAHGRLCPETVMIDQHGAVRIIGLAVEAALWGLPPGRMSTDITDLGALLYAGLTARWAGESRSKVPAAHEVAGRVLRPRKVRAGIPKLLDSMCDELLNVTQSGHHVRSAHDLTTAGGIAESLTEFVGDPAGLMIPEPERLMATIVPPSDDDPYPAEAARPADSAEPQSEPAPAPDPGSAAIDAAAAAATAAWQPVDRADPGEPNDPGRKQVDRTPAQDSESVSVSVSESGPASASASTEAIPAWEQSSPNSGDLPTQAGMPVFDDEKNEVSWLSTHAEKPSPPPPFEQAPARPLFAPEPTDGGPMRTPRPGVQPTPVPEYWPWEGTGAGGSRGQDGSQTGTQPGIHTTGSGIGIFDDFELDEEVPGRSWLRLAAVLAAGMVLLLAVVFAVNLGQGRSVLEFDGSSGQDQAVGGDGTTVVVPDTVANDLDPQGEDQEEFPDLVGFAVDGQPNTAWRSQTYNQQFGPGGLKTGVGLVVDLGAPTDVRRVSVDFVGAPTGVSVYLTKNQPTDVSGLKPIAKQTVDGRLDVETKETGRYVIVWLTSLPAVDGGFRGSIAEVEVRQARS